MSNNKFKSTTIYGKLVVADTPDGSITADTILNRNLTVVGKINNIPSETIGYISNLTSDAQTQLTTLKNKTTDVTYDSLTLTSTYTNDLIVNGKINNVPYNKFAYLTGIYSDVQLQLNPLINKTTDTFYNGALLQTYHANNLLVDGKINNIPKATINYIANLTSDAQTQLTTLQTQTTDTSYSIGTFTTTHANNLVVAGTLNTVPYSKFPFLTGITSDVQTQINNKLNSSDITPINNNITTLQTKTTDISYNNLTSTTTHTYNLIVSGNINGVQNSKFAYLTGITSDIQTQINNKLNSSDITPINNNITTLQTKTTDMSYNNLTSTFGNDLIVSGNINSVPFSKFDFLKNITSDIQTQISNKLNSSDLTPLTNNITTLQTKTTDITYDNSTLTTTHTYNLIVNGNLNSVPFSKFDFLKNISSDIQGQINSLVGLSTPNVWTNTNAFNTYIPTTILTPNASNQFITKAYADSQYVGSGILSGTNTWTGTNAFNTNLPTSTLTPTQDTQLVTKIYTDSKAPKESPTFTGTVTGITKNMVGLGSVDNTSDLLKPVSTATNAQLALKANLVGDNTFTGSMTVNGILYNDINGQGYFTQLYHNINCLNFLSRNDYYNGATGTQLETSIKFFCSNTAKAEKNILTLNSTTATLNGVLNFNSSILIANAITGLNQLLFNNSYDTIYDKIILYAGIGHETSYTLGVTQNILYYNSPGNHKFHIGGVLTTPKLTINSSGSTFTGTVTGITKAMVGLGSVDNTTDLLKPVSTATSTQLDLKAPKDSPTFTGTVSGITKAMVGLGNVDDTSDLNKPVSTATSTQLDLKAPKESPTFTGTVSGITKAMVGLGNVDNTTDLLKPVSTATSTQLDLKAPKESPTFTGTVSGISKAMVGLGNVDNTTDLLKPVSNATNTQLNLCAKLDNNNTFTGNNTITGYFGIGNITTISDYTQAVNTSYLTTITQVGKTLEIKSRNAVVNNPDRTLIQFTLEDQAHNLPVVLQLSADTIKITRPIELGYTSFLTPDITYVGGLKTGVAIAGLPTNGVTKSVVSIAMPIGVWAFSANIRYNATNIVSCKMAIVDSASDTFSYPKATKTQTANASSVCDNISTVLPVPSATTWYLTVLLNFSGTLTTTADDLPFLRATRIA